MDNPTDADFEEAVAEFVGAFETVFRYDWSYTKLVIGDEANDATFIEPKLSDEFSDWASRGYLLEKYRRLVTAMKLRNMSPVFPLPLENIPGFTGRVW